jgi:hypothetical protein
MRIRLFQFAFVASLAGFLCVGCGKDPSSAPVALPEEEIPATVTKAFQNADKETLDTVQQYITDVKVHDLPGAFEELQQLIVTRGLTPDQKAVLASASRTTSQKLREAANNGDANAAEVLRTFTSGR